MDSTSEMAKGLASEYDQIIIEASGLNRREVIVNLHRFSSAVYPDGVEEVSIDGVPFIRLWPVEFEAEFDGSKHVMKCSRQYQKIITHNSEPKT